MEEGLNSDWKNSNTALQAQEWFNGFCMDSRSSTILPNHFFALVETIVWIRSLKNICFKKLILDAFFQQKINNCIVNQMLPQRNQRKYEQISKKK